LPTPEVEADVVDGDAIDGKKITGTKIKAVLAEYKDAHGHSAYKKLLEYFGVTSVRAIPKKDFAAVLKMAAGVGGMPNQPAIPTEKVMDDSQDNPTFPDELDAPEISAEQLRQSLSEHKSRWGMDATGAVITRLGFNTPNDIPADKYGEVFMALANDNPAELEAVPNVQPEVTALGVDLSMF